MSPAKKPPRPVTRWFTDYGNGVIGYMAWDEKKSAADIRCRVTPIRPATDAEIEKLARKLWEAASDGPHGDAVWEDELKKSRCPWRYIARAAWKKGARP